MSGNGTIKAAKKPVATEKKCKDGKQIKSVADFYKAPSNADGYDSLCKACRRDAYYKKRYGESRPPKRAKRLVATEKKIKTCKQGNVSGTTLGSLTQISSVVRAIAEMQFAIDSEVKALDKRIAMLKQYTDEVTTPMKCKQANYSEMIRELLKKKRNTWFTKKYRFGVVRYTSKGKLTVESFSDIAGKRMGKP